MQFPFKNAGVHSKVIFPGVRLNTQNEAIQDILLNLGLRTSGSSQIGSKHL